MKTMILAILACAMALVSCRNEKALRAELNTVESDMYAIQVAASQHQAEMGKSAINVIFGLADTAQNLDKGNYREAAQGANSAIDAGQQADFAGQSLDQLKARFDKLAKRRAEIIKQLND